MALGQAVQARDLEAIRRLSHSLAGAAGNLSAHELAPAARRLEQAAGTGEVANIKDLFDTVAAAFAQVETGVAGLPDQVPPDHPQKPVEAP